MEAPALSFSLFAVASLLAAAFIFARKPGLTLSGPDEAVRLFLIDYWDARVQDVALSRDGKAALLTLSDGRVGIVAVFSDRAVTRRLAPGAIRVEAGDDALVVRITDPSLSRVRLRLEDRERERWQGRFTLHQASRKAQAA